MKYISKFLITILITFIFIGCDEMKEKEPTEIIDTRVPVNISTNPEGATISLDGKDIGVTPKSVLFEQNSTSIIKLTQNNYKPKWQEIICSSVKLNNYNIDLKPITGTIILITEPSGAKVTINDKYYGETPVLLKNLTIGSYSAKLKKDGFVEKIAMWNITNARPKKITKLMNSNVGEIIITSTPSKAKVFINNELRGFTPFQKDMEHGEYKIKIETEGYISYEQIASIQRNKREQVNAVLDEKPATLIVKSNPSDVTLFINGKQYKNTPTIVKNLIPGEYELRLERKDFDPAYKKIKIYRGEELTVNIDLKSNTGGLDLIVNPPGVTVYVNGKIKGITKLDPNLPRHSEIFKLRNLPEGTYTVMLAHKRARPARKTFDLEVTKGKITRSKICNIWISDHIIEVRSGTKYEGRLHFKNSKIVTFEVMPGVTQEFSIDEVKSLTPLKDKE